ncbi:MAG: fibronectin type III domain-containing protein [Candidatus Lloydbacteria bacterium]|nr:fibronectin type III domain-containing protein [Candidatus Lloydbacteria bacterium]
MNTKPIILLLLLVVLPMSVFAAEATIDASIHTTLTSHNGSSPTPVFVSDQVGYAFFRDSAGSCAYSKTTDGGGVWGAAVTVDAQTDCLKIAVWYDRWTPGDSTGANIHIATLDAGDLWYTRLNTSNDTLTTTVNASGANQGGGFAVGANIPSITKGTDGDLYMGVQDTGDSFVIKCLTSADCTQAGNWAEAGTSPFDLATDWLILMPLSGGNILAIRWDMSANNVSSKVYTDASNTWDVAWTTIDANAIENSTYDAHFGATLRKGTGDIYLAYATDVATFGTDDDIRTAVYSAGAWTSKTDVLTNDTKGITGVKISFDENTNDIYAVYTARTTPGTAATGNVYWKKSADGMASWGAEQEPINTTAGDIYGARVNAMSDERIYATWDLASLDDLIGNTVADITPPDTTAPAAISNLALSSPSNSAMTVSWTAPGDDGSTGTATSYDLRYATSLITSDNFSSAMAVTGEPAPLAAGSAESMSVTGLSPSTTYYFAIKTSDEVPNTSAISNVPSLATTATPDTTAPAAVSDLAVSSPTASSLTVSWTAPGDDNNTGTATAYDLRYSTAAIIDGNFSSATQVSGEPSPQAVGASQSMTVTGLSANTTYYFALKTSDEVPNTSAISNVPSGTTSDGSSISIPVSASGGSRVDPARVVFSGQAYPGATIEVLRKSAIDLIYKNTPIKTSEIKADGSFVITSTALLQGEYLFALLAKDKDGRKTGVVAFNADLSGNGLLEAKDIFLPPTLDFGKTVVALGKDLKILGYATPEKKIEIEIDGILKGEVASDTNGFWSFATSTASFRTGNHYARARQTSGIGKKSEFSSARAFRVSILLSPKSDLNDDDKITIADWSIFLFRWGSKDSMLRGKIDMNDDGNIDIRDLSIFLKTLKTL